MTSGPKRMSVIRFRYPTRVTVGVLLILLFALLSSAQMLRSSTFRLLRVALVTGPVADEIAAYDTRFASLKSVLPRRGIVGYIADPRRTDIDFDARYLKKYFLTQYALSPVIVVDCKYHRRSACDRKPDLVVGNFDEASPDPDLGSGDELTLLRDLGDGVRLFSRRSR